MAERCASIIQTALIEQQRQAFISVLLLHRKVMFNNKSLVLTPRQIEILAILVLLSKWFKFRKFTSSAIW